MFPLKLSRYEGKKNLLSSMCIKKRKKKEILKFFTFCLFASSQCHSSHWKRTPAWAKTATSPWRSRWAPPWPTSSPSWRSNMTDALVRNQNARPSLTCRQPKHLAWTTKAQHPVHPPRVPADVGPMRRLRSGWTSGCKAAGRLWSFARHWK